MLTKDFSLSQGDQLKTQDKLSSKVSKTMNQAKLTSLQNNISREGNGTSKNYLTSGSSSHEDCVMVEKPMSFNKQIKGQTALSSQKAEDEERAHGNFLGSKRVHLDISSPKIKSPLSTEENAGASGNGFVTAKAKLVCVALLSNFAQF